MVGGGTGKCKGVFVMARLSLVQFKDTFKEVLGTTMAPSPQIAIFGVPREDAGLSVKQTRLIGFARPSILKC